MKRLAVLALLVAACATRPTVPFRYQPERVPAGRVVHYVKSNLDGTKPILVSIFFADQDHIEVYKSEKDLIDSADVHARLDYTRFSIAEVDAGVILQDGTREHRVALRIDGNEAVVTTGDQSERVRVPHFPLHIYNFDLMSLNAMLPHLVDDQTPFRIGLLEPTFGRKPGFVADEGTVDVIPEGAGRYRFEGAYFPHGATLWTKNGLIDRFESRTPDNPDWNSLRLERRGEERMTREQWDAYRRTHVGVGVVSSQ